MNNRPKHLAEYALVKGIGAVVAPMPYRASLAFAWFTAKISFPLIRKRVTKAEKRIMSVFGTSLSNSEIKMIAWESWRNTMFSGVEMLKCRHFSRGKLDSIYDYSETIETLKRHRDTHKGAVIALSHMGSWEMSAHAFRLNGIPVFAVGAEQKNPLVNAYIEQLRNIHTEETVTRGSGSTRRILKLLKEGGFLLILPDVRVKSNGVAVPFLGGTANIGKGMASLAGHADVPVFPVVLSRTNWHSHKMTVHPPLQADKKLDKQEDVKRITCTVLKIIDDAIRKDPAQWFWYNSRWILDPNT